MKKLLALFLFWAATAMAAQSVVFLQSDATRAKQLVASNTSVTVAQTGNTTLFTIPTNNIDGMVIQCSVTGQALDAFVIQGKAHADATAQTLFSAAGDYTSPTGIMVGASGDMTTLAAAATGWVELDHLNDWYEIDVLASSGNVAGSTVSCYAGGR